MVGEYDGTLPTGGRMPPGTSGRQRQIDVGRLWSGGVATAVVAALIGLVGVLIVRAAFNVALYAPAEAGALGDQSTLLLCVVAAAAALAATGLVHLLLLTTPRPLTYFGWIVGLVTVAVVVAPFVTGEPLAVKLAISLINLIIGIAIGSLVSGAAAAATRPAVPRRRFEIE